MTDPIPLSSLAQYGYCPRRAGLMLLEQVWCENEYTASGRAQHERVHDARVERRGDLLRVMDFPVVSETLGLSGKCDCLEATRAESGVTLPFAKDGRYALYPVEYKHGVVRDEREYQLQLCAQAMCLEEMFGGAILRGALFFTDAHRRSEVEFGDDLRDEVRTTAAALQAMLADERIPPARCGPKCRKCSLNDWCAPGLPSGAKAYCEAIYRDMEGGGE